MARKNNPFGNRKTACRPNRGRYSARRVGFVRVNSKKCGACGGHGLNLDNTANCRRCNGTGTTIS